ncbi:hypothetical protein CARUB_v10006889mg, partial [Capsella rubella]
MDLHLKNLFGRFQDQFGSGPGLGPGSGVCLMKVEGISSNIVQSIFKASASLYRSEPWKRLRPGHLFGVRVGKASDWSGKRQPFQCVQFIGGDGGDIGVYMYRSTSYALKMTDDSWEMARVPNVEVLRVTYELESLMLPSNKRMVKSLSLQVSGTDRFPVIDVARCTTSDELQFRSPTLEEIRLSIAIMKALSLVHPLLLQEESGLPRTIKFSPFIETVDVQWPPEMFNGHDFVAVTVSHPPGQSYEQKSKKTMMAREDEVLELVAGMTNLGVGEGVKAGFSQCTMCEKSVHRDECVCCSHCHAPIYCGSDCENRHWREMHRSVCSLYEAMMSREEELKIKTFNFLCYGVNP